MLIVAGVVAGAVAAAAFDGESGRPLGVQIEWLTGEPTRPQASRADPTERTREPLATPTAAVVTGFDYPVEGACMPEDDNLIPGAPREYRNAIHEGLDFYDWDNCAFIGWDQEVLAANAGEVIRIDHDYEDLTAETLAEVDELAEELGGDHERVTDAYRGRQVWIDHGGGIVTRYAHLNGVAEDLEEGDRVRRGQLVGYVGESGTPESVTDPGTQVHLHFEIRVGASYLGEGRPSEEVRRLYELAFSR